MTLKLTHIVQEARVPRPPVWNYTPSQFVDLPDSDDYDINLTLPEGVPPSSTRIALVMSALWDPWQTAVVGAITIDGVSCTERWRRDAQGAVEFAWCKLPSGVGGETVNVVRTGAGGALYAGRFVMVLLDNMDVVTTWPTPASAGDDIDATPTYNLTMLAGALSFHMNGCWNTSTATTITNATMVDQDVALYSAYRESWGYRESPSDDTALAFTSNQGSILQVQMGVAFNPTLDKAYL
jgi:hypothetical protein